MVRDLPAVGANLHDHFNSYVAWRATKAGTLNDLALLAHRASSRPASSMRWTAAGRSPASARSPASWCAPTRASIGPTCRSTSSCGRSRSATATASMPTSGRASSISPVHLRPEGRGRRQPQEPRSAEPARRSSSSSSRRPTTWTRCSTACGLRARSPSSRRSKPYIAEEVQPGPAVTSDEALIEDLRNRGVSNLHPVGTCRMGHGRRRRGRSAAAGARHPGPAGGGRLDHAAGGRRQHQRALDHDRREGRGDDPRGRAASLTAGAHQ